ncbi:hypothetical protein [Ornithinibacillus bavariensis]|uniref:hypothetical protein n=1 Tax=Ornithinibacillus bavariensis TaxID=545502 RepID=UPI003D1AD61E
MDKQLKDLKLQFEQIPTAFTEKDKEAIRSKIDKIQQKPRRREIQLFPKLLTGLVVTFAIIIFILTIDQQGLLRSGSSQLSDSALEKSSDNKADMAQTEALESKEENSIHDSSTENKSFGNDDSVRDTYHESIALSEELTNIYQEYKTTLDDSLLVDLTPFDVFKLHNYANLHDDLDVVYALYMKGNNHYVPDRDTFMEEAKNDITAKQQVEENYNKMLEINSYTVVYLNENEALVEYQLDDLIGFRLYKDTELNVWKVSYMPIQ